MVLTFVHRMDEVKYAMVTKKKYVMPEIDRDAAGPGAAELIAFAEDLTQHANAVYEKVLELQAEVARLKKPGSAGRHGNEEAGNSAG